jgi:hypothetical protein
MNPTPASGRVVRTLTDLALVRRLVSAVAGLILCSTATAGAAVAAANGDSLNWNGGADASWTNTNPDWFDTNVGRSVNLAKISGSQGDTFSFAFPGAGTNSTVAPTTMNVGTSSDTSGLLFGVSNLSFAQGFNSTNTTTLGSGRTDGLANSLNFVSGWTISDQATSGTVTVQTSNVNNYGLYFTLNGTGTVNVASGATVALNVAISDGSTAGGINLTGGGTLILTCPNELTNYSAGTTASAGTLVVNGLYSTGSGTVTANIGSVLAGTGSITGATTVNSGATLSPGTTVGAIANLKFGGNLTLNGTLTVDLMGGGTTAGVNNDSINVGGTLTLNPTSSQLAIGSVSNRASLAIGQTFYLFLDAGITPVVGSFENALEGGTVTDSYGDTFTVSYLANGDSGTLGNDISLTVASLGSAVPEPSACVSFAAGVVLVGWIAGRRKINAAAGR